MIRPLGMTALLTVASVATAEMIPLDNHSMAAVTGQDGMGMTLEWRVNADATGASKCGSSGTIPLAECRIALSFNNRYSGSFQEWLVLKGVSGRIYIPYLAMDADSVTYTADSGANSGSSVTIPAAKLSADTGGTAVRIVYQIASMAVETDTSATKGYMTTSESGFMGLRIDDAGGSLTLSGSVKLFPCNTDHPRC